MATQTLTAAAALATSKTIKSSRKGLQAKTYAGDAGDLLEAGRRTKWIVGPGAPKSVDDLTFTSRNDRGHMMWWNVVPPATHYWHVHYELGKAYAFEVLDLLNNPRAELGDGVDFYDDRRALGFICEAIARWLPSVANTAATGIASGFFSVVSEFVATGSADR